MNTEQITELSFGVRLRKIRQVRGLSLLDVEKLSNGTLKAVVLGSYERGTRAMSVRRAIEIAEIYGIPIAQLFSDKTHTPGVGTSRLILDLRKVALRAAGDENRRDERIHLLTRYTRSLVQFRQDWNGEVLSLRESDVPTLGIILNLEKSALLQWLEDERLLLKVRN